MLEHRTAPGGLRPLAALGIVAWLAAAAVGCGARSTLDVGAPSERPDASVPGGCRWGMISQERQLEEEAIQDLLAANGIDSTLHSDNGYEAVHSSNATLISGYSHILLHQHDRELSAREQAALSNFIDAGGRLLVTGYDSLGSPTDPTLARLVRCAAPGDGPFESQLRVVDASHPIMRGPAGRFTEGQTLLAASIDHDQCTPMGEARRLVEVEGSSKLQITEGLGPSGRGMVVYWNGNGSGEGPLVDWTGGSEGSQPELRNLFVNVLRYLCEAP